LMVLLAFLHFVFPRHFKWKDELLGLSLINKQLMYVHTFFIALVVLLMGVFCIYSTEDLVKTLLGKQLCFGLFIFWGVRLVFQFFVYSPSLWKGKRFETWVHVLFSLLWTYFTTVFFLGYRGL
ncbi:MAG TPA: hypothetical protein VER36_01940, partial [Flavisolibacter sp.]|nr:hypothetical protein [Flavisolibacter sp.]